MLERLSIAAGTALFLSTATVVSAADTAEFSTKKAEVAVETIASGLADPWGVEVLPDGSFIVTEISGNLRIIRGGKVSEPISGVPDDRHCRHGVDQLSDSDWRD